MRERSVGIDAVRALGITAVVAGHVWTGPLARDLLYTWHVPVFFFLTGYLWTRNRTTTLEWSKRWLSIGRPYVSWLSIFGVLFLAVTWASLSGAFLNLSRIVAGGAYIGRPFSAFWFMTALVIASLTLRLCDRFTPWAAWVMGAGGVLACTLAPGAMSKIPLAAGVSLAGMFFMLAGRLFQENRLSVMHPLSAATALLAASAVMICAGFSAPLDMKRADLGTPLLSLMVAIAISISLILIAETFLVGVAGIAGTAVSRFAELGTLIVLTHAGVLWAASALGIDGLSALALALLIPTVVGLLIRLTSLSPWLLGLPERSANTISR